MSLRKTEWQEVAAELDAHLTGAIVQKVHLAGPRLCFLEVRQVGRSSLLVVSAEPELSRLAVVDARPPSPERALPVQGRLRQELVGARLLEVAFDTSNGSLSLRFDKQGQPRTLIAEVGSAATLVLLAGERVLALSPGREGLRHGEVYAPNPASRPTARSEAPSRLTQAPGDAFPYAQAAGRLLVEKESAHRAEDARRRLVGPLKTRLSRLRRTLQKVEAEASRQDEAKAHRTVGELLSQNLHRIERGAKSVMLTRYSQAGAEEVEVPLDPKRTPKAEAEWHFHQYRRLLRGCEHAARRREELTAQAQALEEELAAVLAEEDSALVERAPPVLAPRRHERARAQPFKEYRSARGDRIWVGKGAQGNDALTFKVARPQDLWLHVRGIPGSHVVVPLPKGAPLPQELLVDAAHLALHHSSAKGEPRGEVIYTSAKFVRKVKGGAPGQVLYTREKSFLVRLEPDRLRRLLASAETG